MVEQQVIIEKIRNLLKLAEDGENDEESQTAILLAQKLMLKHQLSQLDIENTDEKMEVVSKSITTYKRLFWWEKLLSNIVAENFRVMVYVQKNPLPNQVAGAQKIMFMGLLSDVEFAIEMYHLTVRAMKYHAHCYLQEAIQHQMIEKKQTATLRKSYYRGFIDGLNEKFQQQQSKLSNEDSRYALMIKVPHQVKAHYEQSVKGKVTFKTPSFSREDISYTEGYQKGLTSDFSEKGTLPHDTV